MTLQELITTILTPGNLSIFSNLICGNLISFITLTAGHLQNRAEQRERARLRKRETARRRLGVVTSHHNAL